MSGPLIEYRFYTLSSDGHILHPGQVFKFVDDAQALKHARRIVDDFNIEVWQAARLVGTISGGELKSGEA